jgi:hypothetical protein
LGWPSAVRPTRSTARAVAASRLPYARPSRSASPITFGGTSSDRPDHDDDRDLDGVFARLARETSGIQDIDALTAAGAAGNR